MSRNLVIALLGLIIALQACQLGGGRGELPDYSAIFTGSEGIRASFMENLPPKEIFVASREGQRTRPFKIALFVENRGAADVFEGAVRYAPENLGIETRSLGNGYISITTEPDYVELVGASAAYKNQPRPFKLLGKRLENPAGDKEIIVFDAAAKYVSDIKEKRSSKLIATICYKYQTRAGAAVCIDPDIYGVAEKPAACKVVPVALKPQGAPVAVLKVEPIMMAAGEGEISGIKPNFRISASNLGKGKVINPDSDIVSLCTSDIDTSRVDIHELFDIVKVKAFIGGEALDCGDGKLDIGKTGSFVNCELGQVFAADASAFTRELVVLAEYGYVDTQQAILTITKSDFKK